MTEKDLMIQDLQEENRKLKEKIAELEKDKWIPCSERLPELHRVDMEREGEYFMISDSVIVTDGELVCITEYEVDDEEQKGWLNCCGEEMEEIIAWQPLPALYREE